MTKRQKFKLYKAGILEILGNGNVKYYSLKDCKELSELYHSIIDRTCFGKIDICPCENECIVKEHCYSFNLFKE